MSPSGRDATEHGPSVMLRVTPQAQRLHDGHFRPFSARC
jgi:hypothetical protein